MGAGGIGGCYGGLLAQAGNDVTLIARGAHLAAIKEKGLQLIQPEADFTVAVAATDDPSQVGPVDLVIFSVKAHQNSKAVPLIEPLIGEDTTILTIQNGVESADELGQDYGAERVLPGSAYLLSNIISPGVIKQLSLVPRVAFGESNGDRSQRAVAIRNSFCEANIEAELSDDISKALWSKMLYNSPANGMASAARLSPRDLIEYPHGAAMFRSAIQDGLRDSFRARRCPGSDGLDNRTTDGSARFDAGRLGGRAASRTGSNRGFGAPDRPQSECADPGIRHALHPFATAHRFAREPLDICKWVRETRTAAWGANANSNHGRRRRWGMPWRTTRQSR